MNIIIKRWNKFLGKSKYIALSKGDFFPVLEKEVTNISGWYADYDEGRFVYWQDSKRQYIAWKGLTVELLPSSTIKWESKAFGRSFMLMYRGKVQIHAKYHTILRRPWRLITDFLIWDDDWGLEFDLPSYIHSGHTIGDLVSLLAQWNQRNDS